VLLFVALFVLAAGSSGIKASVPSHGADQFDEKDPKELIQMSSYFNFVLLAVCLGAAVSLTVFVWIQDNKGWDWGFGVGAISMLLAVIFFIAGLPMHRIHVVQGSSTVVEILQVCPYCSRKWSTIETIVHSSVA
jgi:peptide/histidine transporter 3/4